MFGRKRSEENLIYADPAWAETPVGPKRRGLRILIAVLIALVLVAVAVTALIILIRGQDALRLPELMLQIMPR